MIKNNKVLANGRVSKRRKKRNYIKNKNFRRNLKKFVLEKIK
jgi:hypothetical protein